MLDTAFYFILNMSVTASAVGGLIILLRFIKPIPRAGIYALWSLVFIRLVFPFALSSKLSLLNFTGNLIKKVVSVPGTELGHGRLELSLSNSIGAAQSYFPVAYKNSFLEMLFSTAAFIWGFGAAAAVMAAIVLYLITSSELRKAKHIKDNIYFGDMVQSPVVFGIFKQKIIIPPDIDSDSPELKYVLLHEHVHIKRHDNLFRLLGVFAACLHWFNPLVWFFFRLFLKDMELTCDLKAVRLLTGEERKRYAQALVNLSSGQKAFMGAAFGKTNVRVRALNVLDYKKLTVLGIVVSVFFVAAAAVALLTNPIR